MVDCFVVVVLLERSQFQEGILEGTELVLNFWPATQCTRKLVGGTPMQGGLHSANYGSSSLVERCAANGKKRRMLRLGNRQKVRMSETHTLFLANKKCIYII